MSSNTLLGYLLLLGFLLSACGPLPAPIPVEQYATAIQGDWAARLPAKRYTSELKYVFSVDDSLCFANIQPLNQRHYELADDTLFVQNRLQYLHEGPLRTNPKTQVFRILEMCSDELVLLPLDAWSRKYLSQDTIYGVANDTLRYQRMQAVTDVAFERIGFYCTLSQMGTGGMYMEIDSSGEVLYYNHRRQTDYYKFRISKKQLEAIRRMVRQVDWEGLEKSYAVSVTDSQTRGLQLRTRDGQTFESSAYHYGQEPAAFRLLLSRLKYLRGYDYQPADSSLLQELQMTDYLSRISWRNPY